MMKSTTHTFRQIVLVLTGALLVNGTVLANGDKPVVPALAKTADIEIPVSIFRDDASGIDPFFPNAKYRIPAQPKLAEVAPVNLADSGVLKNLKLNGMGGVGERSWALVNGVSMYLGESVRMPIGGRAYQLVCLEVKEHSVVIGLKDSDLKRELKLE